MGALRVKLDLVDSYGTARGPNINTLYISRTEPFDSDQSIYEYYVALVPESEWEWDSTQTLDGVMQFKELITPHAKFLHAYNDGAELCAMRAMLALKDAGMIR